MQVRNLTPAQIDELPLDEQAAVRQLQDRIARGTINAATSLLDITPAELSANRKATLETIMEMELPSSIEPDHNKAKNKRTMARLNYARYYGDGYLLAHLGGKAVHAAVDTVRGHSGYIHVRTLCQPHSPKSYASEFDPQGEQAANLTVTCERCLASMGKRGL